VNRACRARSDAAPPEGRLLWRAPTPLTAAGTHPMCGRLRRERPRVRYRDLAGDLLGQEIETLASPGEDAGRGVAGRILLEQPAGEGDVDSDPLQLHEHLRGSAPCAASPRASGRIHAVTPTGPPPEDGANAVTQNEISGTVYGHAVQARHIDAVHFHGSRKWFSIKRKRGRQQ
jgi:hypothetical protein